MKYIKGDLLEAFTNNEIDCMLMQSNCEGLSRFAGIAKAIHTKYPKLTKLHQEFCLDKPKTNNYNWVSSGLKLHDRVGGSWFWLDTLTFGNYLEYKIEDKSIINIYSQIFRGSPSNKKLQMYDAWKFPDGEETEKLPIGWVGNVLDTFDNRLFALKWALKAISNNFKDKKIGLPLIASGLAASRELKRNMTDLEYFKMYIAPIIESVFDDTWDVTVYYL